MKTYFGSVYHNFHWDNVYLYYFHIFTTIPGGRPAGWPAGRPGGRMLDISKLKLTQPS